MYLFFKAFGFLCWWTLLFPVALACYLMRRRPC